MYVVPFFNIGHTNRVKSKIWPFILSSLFYFKGTSLWLYQKAEIKR